MCSFTYQYISWLLCCLISEPVANYHRNMTLPRGFKYRLFLWQAAALTAAPTLFPQSSNKHSNINKVFECPLTLNVQTTKNPSMGLAKSGNLLKLKWSEMLRIKKVQKRKKERKKCVYAYLHLLKLQSVNFMSR